MAADVEPRERTYWKAEGTVTQALARFEAAVEAGSESRQRSAFYRLASYQARTINILLSAFDRGNEPLAQVALENLGALQRAMLEIHRRVPQVVPLPFLVREEAREEFTNNLIMRVLVESGGGLDPEGVVRRLRHLEMLGPVEVVDIEDNLERLLAAGQVREAGGRYESTTVSYTELDFSERGLRALVGEERYSAFAARGFHRLQAVRTRPAAFEEAFADITGFAEPETAWLFEEVANLVVTAGFGLVRPWHFHDVIDSPFPRPYQREAHRVFTKLGYDANVIEAPTGSGKTLMGMMSLADGLRVLLPGQSYLVLVPTAAYQQQWLAELCFNPIGLQLSPEIVFTGTPSQLESWIDRTGQHPAIVLLTYTALSQLSSGIGKGGFDRDSLEQFLQAANIQGVLLDEVHKVVSDMQSVSTDVTRLLVEWRSDGSLRALAGFSGTAEAYRHRFEQMGLDLVHTIPMDDLVAAGFVAPFTEMGVPFSSSARERSIRRSLEDYKAAMHRFFDLLGGERLRAWFSAVPMAERVRIGHDLLGMYKGRRDWETALADRFGDWEVGAELKLTEANLVSIIQIANGWSDADLAREAGIDQAEVDALAADVGAIRDDLARLIYLPQTLDLLGREGHFTSLDVEALEGAAAEAGATHRAEVVKEHLATTLTGLYASLKGWYLRVGEGRVETIKAVIEAERALRDITGTIVFATGRRIHWRDGVANPGYEGVGGLFSQMLGDRRFTVMAALSSEIYLSYDPKDPLNLRIADFVESDLLGGEAADAILGLIVSGLGLDEATEAGIADVFRRRVEVYVPTLRDIRAPRPREFHREVIGPVRRHVRGLDLGVAGERILGRLRRGNEHLRGLVGTFFDYALIARKFRDAHVAELEQVSGAHQRFLVVPMPGTGDRKQLMYELTSRVMDAESLPVNLIIVSSWARTGWNVIAPNLLIDATATADVTAWQQLRGRAIRASRRWTNDCYRLETLILDDDPLAFGDEEGAGQELDESLLELLGTIAEPAVVRRIQRRGFGALKPTERAELASRLMIERNKVTHVYELVKAFGSTSQVQYDRPAGEWRRKENIAAKHAREVAVNPVTGAKSRDESHAPLLYVDDPRNDLPAELQAMLAERLDGADPRIVAGWLGV